MSHWYDEDSGKLTPVGSLLIEEKHVKVLELDSRFDVSFSPDNVYLVLVDALRSTGTWPYYAMYKNKLHIRSMQMPIPSFLPAHSTFGLREYVPAKKDDEDNVNHHLMQSMLIL